ncbi:four-carbon acid sugar kinase family protein [Paralimibaculum aggregatum]|uniref:3-oxo-tetronate kinase n=1 Tax=Paralimibaculum aggregatum TaxID=3036245 RepID=A0ABQ6LQ38_9RHOB|nr:3-oxo-tetronate kinase [Limibaculum sp. NKW23]GMG84605.1 four-carbon acid sugar kinase family protein [Limibaculum sp. NKW23]
MARMLGAVADDFTGATDLASMLTRGGLATVLQLGVPEAGAPCPEAGAVVVALKSRTAPVAEAVAESRAAWAWMAGAGIGRAYFKYCSTFDSTPAGNIGPVAEALMADTGAPYTVYTPALPENGRTIYMGKLFVGDRLLSETGMAKHPLTPMTDADLVRVLAPQLAPGAAAGLVGWPVVRQGAAAIRAALEAHAAEGRRHLVVDAVAQGDLDALAEAVRDLPLVTAGSGLGISLARVLTGTAGEADPPALPAVGGPAALLSGSCSEATNAQVARWEADGGRLFRLDPLALAAGDETVPDAMRAALAEGPALLAATQPPEQVARVQAELGTARAAALVEEALARTARRLRAEAGVRRFIVAGGETSGAVAQALGATQLRVGRSIAPGVPWCTTLGPEPVALALKSGNFGAVTFFADALETAP